MKPAILLYKCNTYLCDKVSCQYNLCARVHFTYDCKSTEAVSSTVGGKKLCQEWVKNIMNKKEKLKGNT